MDSPSTTFFSYSRVDSEFVLRLAQDLRAAGANVWLDQLDIGGGQRWDNAVQAALRRCPNQIVVLSPDSVNSNNVMDEVSYALEEHKQVIPVLYRECEMPFRLRRVQYVDFRSDYQHGLSGLLKALGVAETAGPPPIPLSRTQPVPQPPAAVPGPSLGQAVRAEPARELIAQEKKNSAPSLRERFIGALVGAVLGAIGISLILPIAKDEKDLLLGGLVYLIAPTAIVGAITGFRRTVIKTALAGGILGWIVISVGLYLLSGELKSVLGGFIIGFPLGALLGAIVKVIYLRRASKRKG